MITDALRDVARAVREAADRRGIAGAPAWQAVSQALDQRHPERAEENGTGSGADADADDGPGPLERVAEVFHLIPPEVDLLVVAAAADLDPVLARAFGLLGGEDGPRPPSAGLALELCGIPVLSGAGRSLLAPVSRLRRWGLVHLGDGPLLLDRTLTVTEDVLGALLDFPVREPVSDAMTVRTGTPSEDAPAAGSPTDLVARVLGAGAPLVWVEDAALGSGHTTAVGAFHAAGVQCSVFDLTRRPPDVSAVEAVTAAVRRAGLLSHGMVVVGAEALTTMPDAAQVTGTLVEAPVPVVLVGRCAWDPAWYDDLPQVVAAEAPSTAERIAAWRRHVGPDQVPDRELTAFRLTPRQVDVAGRHVAASAALQGRPVDHHAVVEAVRMLGGSRQRVAGPARVAAGFDDLQLPADTQAALRRLTDWVRLRDEVLAGGVVQGLGGKGSGIAALFTGSPGTGKTLAAHVIAHATGLELMQVDLSGVVDKYVGETEKNLERIFAQAENLNVVLFFDEADALFGTRSGVTDSRDRYANQGVSYLLQRMEQFDGVTILATNLRGNLDPAFARRLHFIVHFPDPDEATRVRLWRQLLAAAGPPDPADPVRADELGATVELTGGALRNIVLAATYDAAIEGSGLGHRHLVAAAQREYVKLGRRRPAGLE